MKTATPKTPKLRHHKASGQGLVVLNGRAIYLGRYDLPETRQQYHRLVAEWEATGRRPPGPAQNELTVMELCAAFWRHAEEYYRRPDGRSSSSLDGYRMAMGHARRLYGRTRAVDFGPVALKTVRTAMVADDWSRRTCNKATNLLRRIFRWGVAEQMIPPTVATALAAVEPLHRGRTTARETARVRPVPEDDIDAVEEHVSRQVWGLIRLQRYTAARPGELVKLRATDIDMSGDVWTVRLADHKEIHRDLARTLYLGPRAQAVIDEFLTPARPADAPLFSPREAYRELAQRGAHCARRPGQAATPRKTGRSVGSTYSVASYRRAIERGCLAASVPAWTPHRLRHNAATEIRRQFGLEAAQVILGHRDAQVTQLYAERDEAKAIKIAALVG